MRLDQYGLPVLSQPAALEQGLIPLTVPIEQSETATIAGLCADWHRKPISAGPEHCRRARGYITPRTAAIVEMGEVVEIWISAEEFVSAERDSVQIRQRMAGRRIRKGAA